MKDDDQELDKINELLKRLPKRSPDDKFDNRFWNAFEAHQQAKFGSWFKAPQVAVKMSYSLLAIAAFASVMIFVILPVDRPAVALTQGSVILMDAHSTKPLILDQRLNAGDRILTGPSGWAVLELKKGYQLKIHPDTEILIEKLTPQVLPGKTFFQLVKGQVLINIGGEHDHSYPLEVHTSNAFAQAKGTQFQVTAPNLIVPATAIKVLGGKVRVGQILEGKIMEELSVLVKPGQKIEISAQTRLMVPRAMAEKTLADLREMFQFSKENQAILLISMSPSRVDDLLKPCAIYLRYSTKNRDIQNIEGIVKDIQKFSEINDAERLSRAVSELEVAITKQDKIDVLPVYLFLGAYQYYLKKPVEALRLFDKVARNYRQSSFRSLALLASSKIRLEIPALRHEGIQGLNEILALYPQSYEAPVAKALLGI